MELATCCVRETSLIESVIYRVKEFFRKKPESGLKLHAQREFKAMGYPPIAECEDDPNKWMQENVMELLAVFAKQGHSGFSASYCIEVFQKLARYQPLGPITGADEEWNNVSDYSSKDSGPVYQNKRCSYVFKDNGGAYDIDAVAYKKPSGATFTKGGARHYIKFPYTPATNIIKVDFDGDEISDAKWSVLAADYEAEYAAKEGGA